MIESKFSRLIRLRRYEEIESYVSAIMKKGDWSDVVQELRELKPPEYTLEDRNQRNAAIRKAIVNGTRFFMSHKSFRDNPHLLREPNFIWGVREGKVRDVLIRLLGLEQVNGIDCDLLNEFSSITAKTIKTLRRNVVPKTKLILKEQFKRGNTFFLDTDRMMATPYAVLVPDIVESREKEVRELPKKTTQSKIASTYYGFTIITQGGMSPESVKAFNSLSKSYGSESALRKSKFPMKQERFQNCTEYTQKLLLAMLKISIGGKKSTQEACRTLGLLGDSRATNLICDRLTKIGRWKPTKHLLSTLCQIGDPLALETILNQSAKGTKEDRLFIHSLGGLRTKEVVPILSGILRENKQHWGRGGSSTERKLTAVKALGYTHNENAVEILSEALYHRSLRIALEAFRTLIVHSETGRIAVKENVHSLERLFSKSYEIGFFRIMKGFPDLFDVPEVTKKIAQMLAHQQTFHRVILAFKEHPIVVFRKEWKDACIELMKKTKGPPRLRIEIDELVGIEK